MTGAFVAVFLLLIILKAPPVLITIFAVATLAMLAKESVTLIQRLTTRP